MIKLKDPDLLKQKACINGVWCNADGGKRIEVTNPATGELIGSVPDKGQVETLVVNYRRLGGMYFLSMQSALDCPRFCSPV